jgi:hypothetical protein
MQCVCAILSSVACPALQYYATLSLERRDLKKSERKICIFIFSTNLSETFLTLRRNERDMTKICIGLHVKYLLFLSEFIVT